MHFASYSKISDKFSFFDRHREKKTSDAIIAEFEAQIGRQTSSMRKVIVNEEKKMYVLCAASGYKKTADKESREQKRVEFKTTFEELFAACAPGITKGIQKQQHTNDRNSRAEHILFEEAESVKRGSQELLAKFERMDEMLKSQDLKLPLQAWTQDRHDYTEIMMCGREHGQQVAEGILAPGLYDEPPTRSRDLTENQEIAAGLLKESKKALVEDSWGTVFDDQLRCGVALANTISAEVLKPKGTRLS